jgi:gentisate 1,2-dioxygenase
MIPSMGRVDMGATPSMKDRTMNKRVVDDVTPRRAGFESLEDLYREAERLDVTPGWVSREKPIFWKEPRTDFVPAHWEYQPIKDALTSAGSLVDVALAERRNLVLRNPFPGNGFATARTLVCAYQMILPGEIAPSHRHSAHALRVILEAKGSYSVVNGVKTPMETGDVVLTPGGSWHGHGHEGAEPAYWLDGLDIPSVHLLEPMFFEPHPDHYEEVTSVAATSPYRYSRESILKALDQAKDNPEEGTGPRIALEAADMPAMGLTVEKLQSGNQTRSRRSTANRIFVAMEGAGQSKVGERVFSWTRGDTFVVPTWVSYSHRVESDALLFCLSDEPLMRFLKCYRTEHD